MWIYLIHFDRPHFHAQHYLGATTDIQRRIHAHAYGHGSRLMSAINEEGIGWQLAKLWTTNDCWTGERLAKAQKHGPWFCPICSPQKQMRIPNATSYPIASLPPNFVIRHTPLKRNEQCTSLPKMES